MPLDQLPGGVNGSIDGLTVFRHFGDPRREYEAASTRAGLTPRLLRGLIEVRGGDRVTWLNNFVTNQVKTLGPGEGVYAFACNAKGRIVVDMNVLVREDSIWLDVDRRRIAAATAHLGKYIIVEDVALTDRSDGFSRIGVIGPAASDVLAVLGAGHAAKMAVLQTSVVNIDGLNTPFVRSDLLGRRAFELFVEPSRAVEIWDAILRVGQGVGIVPVGEDAVNIMRIEAGIPAPVEDIDEDVLPAETGQLARAVSFTKGCYLGQEVVERMRSRGSVGKLLVGLRFDGPVPRGSGLYVADRRVGRVTSVCESPAVGAAIGLGYAPEVLAKPGTELTAKSDDIDAGAVVASLPFVRRGE